MNWTTKSLRERAEQGFRDLALSLRARAIAIHPGQAFPGSELALCYEGGRLRALAAHQPVSPDELGQVLATSGTPLPTDILMICGDHGPPTLWKLAGQEWKPVEVKDAPRVLQESPERPPDARLAQRIVAAIAEEHLRELNGQLVQGLLSLLKRQFPRPELYLFELLQNAVDDGALRVAFRVDRAADRLVVEHDGSPFTAVDVLGLSSVGLSGKSGRTIGFMGVGFKAVYRRFARVRVTDDTWRFVFEEPPDKDGDGWKVLPRWEEHGPTVEYPFRCRFDLERPRGGVAEILSDLGFLPDEAPVLLGRRALHAGAATAQDWRLEWNDRSLSVTAGPSRDDSGVEVIEVREQQAFRSWRLLSQEFDPSPEAMEAFRTFREDPKADPGRQEVSLFFETLRGGNVRHCPKGQVFAILPTKLGLPMGYHLQANWLLTTDRQDVQALRDSPWNRELAQQLPSLVQRLLCWIAGAEGPTDLQTAYQMLPGLQEKDSGGHSLSVLGLDIDMEPVVAAVTEQHLAPVLRVEEEEVPEPPRLEPGSRLDDIRQGMRQVAPSPRRGRPIFARAPDVFLVPEALVRRLSGRFLENWLDHSIFALDVVGAGSAFWESLGVLEQPNGAFLDSRTPELERLLLSESNAPKKAWGMIRFLAAFHEANGAGQSSPVLHPDPTIFPTDAGRLVRSGTVTRLAGDYFLLPGTVREILKPHLDPPDRRLSLVLQQQLFLPRLPEGAGEEVVRIRETVRRWLSQVGTEVSVAELVQRFFARQVGHPLGPVQADQVAAVTHWACKSNRRDVIDHVLVARDGNLHLAKTEEAALGRAYGEPEIETAARSILLLISDRYLLAKGEDTATIPADRWATFFRNLEGFVGHGLYLTCHRLEGPLHYRSSKLQEWLDGPPPKTRATDHQVQLPYGLGWLANDQFVMAGTDLAEPWQQALDRLEHTADIDAAQAFAALLTRVLPEWSKDFAHVLCYYIPYGSGSYMERSLATRPARWMQRLAEKRWIPRDGGGLARPGELLLDQDIANPEAPFADLPVSTKTALRPIASRLQFGKEIPRQGPLARLMAAAVREAVPDATVVQFWAEVIEAHQKADAQEQEEMEIELRRIAFEHPLLPCGVSRSDGVRRVAARRAIGGAPARAMDLGHWLLRLRDPECLLQALAPDIIRLLGLPEEADGERVLDYLEYVWREQLPMDSVRDQVVAAYRVLARELGGLETPAWGGRWEDLRQAGRVKVYCKPRDGRGRWLEVRGTDGLIPVFDDDPAKAACLRPEHGYAVEIMIARLSPLELRERALQLLGLLRLSDTRFQLSEEPVGFIGSADEETGRFRRLLQILGQVVQEEDAGSEVGVLGDPCQVTLRRCEKLRRTFRVDGGPAAETEVLASWKSSQEVFISGKEIDYVPPLRNDVLTRLHQERPSRRVTELLDLLLYLEHEERFERTLHEQAAKLNIDLADLPFLETAPPAGLPAENPEAGVPPPGLTGPSPEPGATTFSGLSADMVGTTGQAAQPADSSLEGATGSVSGRVDAGETEDHPGSSERRPADEDGDSDSEEATREPGDQDKTRMPRRQATSTSPGPLGSGGRQSDAASRPSGDQGGKGGTARNWFRVLARLGKAPQPAGRGGTSYDDLEARKAVVEYENRRTGWKAEAAKTNQEGYDVVSENVTEKKKRFIEVKGLQDLWVGKATVTLSRPQFDAARAEHPEGVEYWLYVVDKLGDPPPKVHPIRCAASKVQDFYFQAQDWRDEAEREATSLTEDILAKEQVTVHDLKDLPAAAPEGRFAVRYPRADLSELVRPGGLLLFRRLRPDDAMPANRSIVLVCHPELKYPDQVNGIGAGEFHTTDFQDTNGNFAYGAVVLRPKTSDPTARPVRLKIASEEEWFAFRPYAVQDFLDREGS